MSGDTDSHEQHLEEMERLRQRVLKLEALVERSRGTEEALEQRTAELEAVFQAFPDLCFLLDSETKISGYYAGRASDLYVPPEAFLGHRMEDVLPPLVADQFHAAFELLAQGAKIATVEYSLTLPDGDKIFEGRILPLPESHVIAIIRDITERKLSEEALRQYARIVSGSTDMLAFLDTDFVYLAVNEAYAVAFEKSQNEIVGRSASDVFGEEFFRTVIKPHAQRCLNGEEVHYREWMDFPLRRRFMEITYFPYTTNAGEVDGFVVNGRDITDQKLAKDEKAVLEAELLQAQKMEAIGRLAGGVAHDFNNMLSGIMSFATLLQMDLDPEDPKFEPTEEILNICTRARDLTVNLLGFARKGKVNKKRIDPHDSIREVTDILRQTLSKKIKLEIQLAARLSGIDGDSGQINQILMNLCINAADAMGDEGTLTIATRDRIIEPEAPGQYAELEPGRYIELSVTDTGAGMASDVKTMVFEPFFTTKPLGKGTGLGLSMVYGAVKNHGGIVLLNSEPGEGTTFTIVLPALDPAGGEPRTKSVVKPIALTTGQGTILLVDDEPVMRSASARLLERIGYRVIQAEGGHKALKLYRERLAEIDLVVLDISMPVMDGPETFGHLQKIDPGVRTLLFSGYSADATINRLLAEGAVGFLQKPFRLAALADAVAKALTAHRPGSVHGD